MRTVGIFTPETVAEARERYEAAGPAAQTAMKEATRAMAFDGEEYRDRVSSEVIETARDAIFASLLAVHVGNEEAFETWCADHPDYEVSTIGSEHVSGVAWHPVPFEGTVVAATFESEPDAAVATLRRRAFGSVYRERL